MELVNSSEGRNWEETGRFPRVTWCDFDVKGMGNVQRSTVQCVLMVNMLNEKIYVFLWFWFIFLALCSFLDLLYWVFISVSTQKRDKPIGRYLRISNMYNERSERETLRRFTERDILPDGALLLRFISVNAGDIVALHLTAQLWKNYEDRYLISVAPTERGRETPESREKKEAEEEPAETWSRGSEFQESLYYPKTPPVLVSGMHPGAPLKKDSAHQLEHYITSKDGHDSRMTSCAITFCNPLEAAPMILCIHRITVKSCTAETKTVCEQFYVDDAYMTPGASWS